MSMEPKKTVLIVEDEVNIVDIVRFNLQREGYATLEAYRVGRGAEEGPEECRRRRGNRRYGRSSGWSPVSAEIRQGNA